MRAPFQHCPGCGKPGITALSDKELRCPHCAFHYFHNVAAAVSVVLWHDEHVLFAVRGRAPGRGLLDLPGGFVEPGENLEQGLRREVAEELGLTLPDMQYVGSFANEYRYDGILYHTTDAIFETRFRERPATLPADDVNSVRWLRLDRVVDSALAFRSVRAAIQLCQQRLATSG